jgi:DNA-binding CsgD family transcriptional regulator
MLEAGLTGREIAESLGISETQVSIIRRRLGLAKLRKRSRFDWKAVQAFYNDDHTFGECCDRFGLSAGAWAAAVARGDLVPRTGNGLRRPGETRRRVAELLERGRSFGAIARELGLAVPTVSYHARKLGIEADHRCAKRYDWAEIQRYYDDGHSITECQEHFGFARASWAAARRRGAVVARTTKRPIEEYLVVGRRTNRHHLKNRLLDEGLKRRFCEECGTTEWRGRPVRLALHHINGDGLDNRLENLQLLCGNCHGLTENFGVRNWRSRRAERRAKQLRRAFSSGRLVRLSPRVLHAAGQAAACSAQSR